MNEEQQVTEDQQAEKPSIEYAEEQERVHTAYKYIEILSGSLYLLSSDDSSETSYDDSSDSGKR